MKRIAVLCSGGGTNLQALIDAQGTVLKSGEIALVIANCAGAFALERAKKAGIPTATVLKKECGSQAAFEEKRRRNDFVRAPGRAEKATYHYGGG